ncbi:MAG: tryptophan--tRNA ligase [Ignisphaera sp.]|nr:tryptophan--tRNA ligase [Ignisphaera sp.]
MELGTVSVTPWEAEAFVDYDRLIKVFGAKPLTDNEINMLKSVTEELHIMISRRVFYSHRDFDKFLEAYKSSRRCALYTGRGPSGNTHLGHMLPWIFTKWLQDKLGLDLFFQMTDDEKFWHTEEREFEYFNSLAYENILDLAALGLDHRKTHVIIDSEDIGYLYPIVIKIAKKITFSVQRATFGFTDSTNVGMIFYPTLQMAVAFLPSELFREPIEVLIPAGIDQDPYWRIARDIATSLGYPKPSQIHNKLLPGLGIGGKMSSSKPETAIYTTDPPELAYGKVVKAYTGGRATAEEQRKFGGNPDVCPVYKMYEMMFEENDMKLYERYYSCRGGSLLCGECKTELAERVARFLKEHQSRRIRAVSHTEKYLIRNKFDPPIIKRT